MLRIIQRGCKRTGTSHKGIDSTISSRTTTWLQERGIITSSASSSSSSSSVGSIRYFSDAPKRYENWEDDPRFSEELKKFPQGRQLQKDFKMGAYAHTWKKSPDGKVMPVGTWIVSPAKDPVTFVVNSMIIFILIYTIANLSWGESYMEKRRRVLRERIRQEYDLPQHWDSEIDDDDDLSVPPPKTEAKLEAITTR